MDINKTHNNAALSEEEVRLFRNTEMGNVVSLDELRKTLPMLLELATSRFESTQVSNPSLATPAMQAEAAEAKAEMDLVEAMNTDLMMFDFGNFLDEL